MAADCLFCKIAAGQIPSHKVYEDDHALAFLDITPLTRGHTLVIPRSHSERLEDMKPEEAGRLLAVAHRVLPRICKAVGASAATLAFNNGRDAGQEVPHVHLHIVPRTPGDGGQPLHALFPRRSPPTEDLAGLARSMAATT